MAESRPEILTFRANFAKFTETLSGRMDEFDRRVATSLAQNVIEGGDVSPGTPLRTGFARNSWVVALGEPGEPRQPPRPASSKEPVTVVAMTEAEAVLANLKGDTVVWITSNCVYMLALENGASNITPVGMMALAVGGSQQIADTVASEMVR